MTRLDVSTDCSDCEARIREEVIEEYRKEMQDIIEGDDEFTDWQRYEILMCNEVVAEELKEKKNG